MGSTFTDHVDEIEKPGEVVDGTIPISFRHQPLEEPKHEVRLLEIFPGSFEEEIGCTLRAYDWSSRPKYTAISYVWGVAPDPAPIWINGAISLVDEIVCTL